MYESRSHPMSWWGSRCLAVAVAAAIPSLLPAQSMTGTAQRQQAGGTQQQATTATQAQRGMQAQRQQDMQTITIALPSGEEDSSVLKLERIAPRQTMVGQANRYQIRVTNISDTVLGQVTVSEMLGQGMQIASSQPPAQSQQQGGRQQAQQQMQQQQQAQQQQRQQQQQQRTQQQQLQQQGQQQQSGGGQIAQWHLGMLAPDESKTIQVNAVVSQMGTINSCLTATYFPALCAVTEVVQPNLELVAQIEAKGGQFTVCDTPAIRYQVRNSGSGVAEDVTVIHPLPQGLSSADGQSTITLPIGNLNAGETKEATAQIRAGQPGQFESRAYAQSSSDDAYSSPIAVRIGQPQLDVQIVGPEQVPLGDPVQYNVTVRNTGDVATQNTTLQLQTEGIDEADRSRDLGRIEPGKAAAVSVAVRQTGVEKVQLAVRTQSACAEDAMSSATTRIQTIPALRLEVVDRTDPVRVGENTVYAISVKNQGNAPAQNVTLTATLPQQLQFVEGSGTTAVNAQGQQVQFEALPSLNPNDVAAWYVTVKGASAGDARLQLEMNGDYLDQPIVEQEPTRVQ